MEWGPEDEVAAKRVQTLLEARFTAQMVREDNVPSLIERGLYLGSIGAALNKPKLKALNITHVLIVARSLDPAHPDDFVYKKIDVIDSPATHLSDYFEECIDFIDQAISSGGGILVHCFAGMSRSVTIVVAYLMKKNRMTRDAALSFVTSRRPVAGPNMGFIKQLDSFEESLGLSQ